MAAEFPRDFLGISLPDEPYKYYFVVRGQRIIVEVDLSIQAIMDKLQSYKLRVALNFEVALLALLASELAELMSHVFFFVGCLTDNVVAASIFLTSIYILSLSINVFFRFFFFFTFHDRLFLGVSFFLF
ncbi:hypothetical protein Dimus_003516 [Dionaea muscipula]